MFLPNRIAGFPRTCKWASLAALIRLGAPLEVHAPWLLTLIEEQPDLTLDEVVSAMHKHGIAGSRTAVWSFFERHNISFKKKPARRGAGSPGRGPGTSMLAATASHAYFHPTGVHRRAPGQYATG